MFDYDANLILRTNLSTGVQTVFCDVPGCTHTTSSCPARITDQMYSLVPAGDCVYLVYGTYSPTTAKGASGADINAMSDDEIMRWARAADAGVPLALYTQELEPYTQEDVTAARRWMQNAFGQGRIEMLDGTTRTELVRLDHDAVYIGGCDSTYLYGIMRSQQGEEPTRWFRMERTTSLCCSGSAAPNHSLPIKCPITAWPAVILPGSRTPVMTLCCTTPSPPKAGGYTA